MGSKEFTMQLAPSLTHAGDHGTFKGTLSSETGEVDCSLCRYLPINPLVRHRADKTYVREVVLCNPLSRYVIRSDKAGQHVYVYCPIPPKDTCGKRIFIG